MSDTWTPCEFGGPETHQGGGKFRRCYVLWHIGYSVMPDGSDVVPQNCARCPIPKLIAALTKARIQCSWLLSEFQDAEMRGTPADVVEGATHVRELCEIALAAVDATKGGA